MSRRTGFFRNPRRRIKAWATSGQATLGDGIETIDARGRFAQLRVLDHQKLLLLLALTTKSVILAVKIVE